MVVATTRQKTGIDELRRAISSREAEMRELPKQVDDCLDEAARKSRQGVLYREASDILRSMGLYREALTARDLADDAFAESSRSCKEAVRLQKRVWLLRAQVIHLDKLLAKQKVESAWVRWQRNMAYQDKNARRRKARMDRQEERDQEAALNRQRDAELAEILRTGACWDENSRAWLEFVDRWGVPSFVNGKPVSGDVYDLYCYDAFSLPEPDDDEELYGSSSRTIRFGGSRVSLGERVAAAHGCWLDRQDRRDKRDYAQPTHGGRGNAPNN